MEEKHYICTGGCKGVSQNPGVCQAENCPKHGQELTECSCANDAHDFSKKPKKGLIASVIIIFIILLVTGLYFLNNEGIINILPTQPEPENADSVVEDLQKIVVLAEHEEDSQSVGVDVCKTNPEYCADTSLITDSEFKGGHYELEGQVRFFDDFTIRCTENVCVEAPEDLFFKCYEPEDKQDCVSGELSRKSVSGTVEVVLTAVESPDGFTGIEFLLDFYESGTKNKLNIPTLGQRHYTDTVYFFDEDSIFVLSFSHEAARTYYWFNGSRWVEVYDWYKEFARDLYYSQQPIPVVLGFSDDGLMQIEELSWTYTEFSNESNGDRFHNLGTYSFLYDLRSEKFIGNFIKHIEYYQDEEKGQTTRVNYLNFKDAIESYPKYKDLLLGLQP